MLLYAFVFIGSLAGILILLGIRIVLRRRSIRRFVRSVKQRFESAENRNGSSLEEKPVERPRKSHRQSAIEMQEVKTILREVDKVWKQERYEEAERLLIQGLTVIPTDVETRAQLARLYLLTERENKAEAMYRELLQEQEDVSFYANLGLALYRQQKFTESCQAYQDALQRDPKNPERTYALARACIAAQRFEEAAPLLEKASQFLAKDTELLHLLAECYLQMNKFLEAQDTYMRIHKLEPYNEEVKAKLKAIKTESVEKVAA